MTCKDCEYYLIQYHECEHPDAPLIRVNCCFSDDNICVNFEKAFELNDRIIKDEENTKRSGGAE